VDADAVTEVHTVPTPPPDGSTDASPRDDRPG
jgi:hypothetical protein